MSSYDRVIGIDVSSTKLDIADSLGKLSPLIEQFVEAISKMLKKWVRQSRLSSEKQLRLEDDW